MRASISSRFQLASQKNPKSKPARRCTLLKHITIGVSNRQSAIQTRQSTRHAPSNSQTNNARGVANPCVMSLRASGTQSSRSKSIPIFDRVCKSFDHVAPVCRVRIEDLDPLEIENVGIPSQVAKILHYYKRLVAV